MATGTQFVTDAEQYITSPYVYGGNTPAGFDCSGLVQYVLEQLGIGSVPRTSESQYAWAQPVSSDNLQPGDLVFAQFPGDNASPGHVGIYVGGGKVFSAQDQQLGIGYDTLADWGSNIVGYGRVPGLSYAGEGSGSGPGGSGGGGGGGSGGSSTQTLSFLGDLPGGSLISGIMTDMGALTHTAAVMIDSGLMLFRPGQAHRLIFWIAAFVLGLLAFQVLRSHGSGQHTI